MRSPAHSDGTSTTVVTDPLGNSVTTDYDDQGRLVHRTDQEGYGRSFTYNSRGFTSKVTDDTTGDYVALTTDSARQHPRAHHPPRRRQLQRAPPVSTARPPPPSSPATTRYYRRRPRRSPQRQDAHLPRRPVRLRHRQHLPDQLRLQPVGRPHLPHHPSPPAAQPSGRTETWTYSDRHRNRGRRRHHPTPTSCSRRPTTARMSPATATPPPAIWPAPTNRRG